MPSSPNIDPCGALVRAHDPDRFLLSLFAPPESRPDLWALFAFNHEIGKTREVVNETRLGLIRLQWWREAVGALYEGGAVPAHEILQALDRTIRARGLPREAFESLIYAREFDLEDVLPSTLEGTLRYAEMTSAPLMSLAVRATGVDPEGEPVREVAVNYALAGLLRAVPFHARQRRCFLPENLLRREGVDLSELYGGRPAGGLARVVEGVAGCFQPALKPRSPFLKAAQALSALYMRQIAGEKFDVFSPGMRRPPAFRELRVATAVYFL
ncbi:MAG: squalene/phytoene synthase family protein [Alphaproteobacteria bacterium]|nr:squalene/phytoene synthase family protein [Alphaproteobacteria bacterium]